MALLSVHMVRCKNKHQCAHSIMLWPFGVRTEVQIILSLSSKILRRDIEYGNPSNMFYNDTKIPKII